MNNQIEKIGLELNPETAAKVMRALCGGEGKDVIQHLLEIMAKHNSKLPSIAFNSTVGVTPKYPVGTKLSIRRYNENYETEITGFDPQRIDGYTLLDISGYSNEQNIESYIERREEWERKQLEQIEE